MKNKNPHETKDKILDAVETYLEKNPGLSFSLEKVARLAKVSKGGLLYHYPTKENLLEALVERMIHQFNAAVANCMSKQNLSFTWAYIETSLHPSAVRSMRSMIAVASIDEKILSSLKSEYKQWENALTADLNDAAKSLAIRLMLDGYLLAATGDLSKPTKDHVLKALKAFIISEK